MGLRKIITQAIANKKGVDLPDSFFDEVENLTKSVKTTSSTQSNTVIKNTVKVNGKTVADVTSDLSGLGIDLSKVFGNRNLATNNVFVNMGKKNFDEEIKMIKMNDPEFDISNFKAYAKKVFISVEIGFANNNPLSFRPYLSNNVYSSEKLQLENMTKNGLDEVIVDLKIDDLTVTNIEVEESTQKITTQIESSRIVYVQDESGKVITGDKNNRRVDNEYWVFARDAKAKSEGMEKLMNDNCPNCGAPISIDDDATCKYCDRVIINGDYSWDLVEISPA